MSPRPWGRGAAALGRSRGGRDRPREPLTDVLGCDADTGSRLAAGLLEHPHPLVASAAAAWTRPGAPLGPGFHDWRAALPAAVATGDLPDQAELDAWAQEHTFGLIDRFPVDITPGRLPRPGHRAGHPGVLADAVRPGPRRRAGLRQPVGAELSQVLQDPAAAGDTRSSSRSPPRPATPPCTWPWPETACWWPASPPPTAWPTATSWPPRSASPAPMPPAMRPVRAARSPPRMPRRRRADLPLGEAPLWQIQRGDGRPAAARICAPRSCPPGRRDSTHHPQRPGPGLRAAAPRPGRRTLAGAQAALARYTRTGFEAAAITGLAVAAMAMPRHQIAGWPSCGSRTLTRSSPRPIDPARSGPASARGGRAGEPVAWASRCFLGLGRPAGRRHRRRGGRDSVNAGYSARDWTDSARSGHC